MSLLKKILGTDTDGLLKRAERLFEDQHFGDAKLSYDKALETVTDENRRTTIVTRIAQCKDGIGRQRLDQGKLYVEQRILDLARQELEGVIEVAADPLLAKEAQGIIDSLEQDDAREQVIDQTVTDEERLALIIGQWEEAQADEYDAYGEPLLDALLQVHREEFEEGRRNLEQILESAENPRYLWLEIGRARLLTSDLEGGRKALDEFLSALEPSESGEARLSAHIELARLADDADDFDGAMAQFQAAVEASQGDFRPYLAMGAYLRSKNHPAEAIDVLQAGLDVATTEGPNWRTLQELGLAYQETGQAEQAAHHLQQVIEFFNSRQYFDYPVESAVPLAQLYEEAGRLDRAADLYRALSEGSDQENIARYHLAAGRVLRQLGLDNEAHRMLTRAEALAAGDDALIDLIRDALGARGETV